MQRGSASAVRINGVRYNLRTAAPNLGAADNRLGTVYSTALSVSGSGGSTIAGSTITLDVSTAFKLQRGSNNVIAKCDANFLKINDDYGIMFASGRSSDLQSNNLTNLIAPAQSTLAIKHSWNGSYGTLQAAVLQHPATNTIEQRNGVNAQSFATYSSYTDVSNYERLRSYLDGTTGRWRIATEAAGTGVSRHLSLMSKTGYFYFEKEGESRTFWIYFDSGGKPNFAASQNLYFHPNVLFLGESWDFQNGNIRFDKNSDRLICGDDQFGTDLTIRSGNGSGTDATGASLYLGAGAGTGTGAGGTVAIRTAPPGASGAAVNALVNQLLIYDNGDTRAQNGDVEAVTLGKGFILKSPDGTRWRIQVDNAGVLSAAAA